MKSLYSCLLVFPLIVCSTSLAQATDMGPIVSAETKLGTLTDGAQIDVFTFNGQTGQTVLIRMSRETGTLSPEIELYDPHGSVEKKEWDGSCAEIVGHPLAESGTYTITATDYWGSYTGDYSLSLLLIPGPTVSPQDPDGGDIFSGETKTGSLSFAADTDAYTFNGESGQTVTISMSRETGTLSPQIVLCDPDGAVEADTWDGSNAQITAHPLAKTGTYTIVPMDYWGGYTGDYSLSLVQLPSAPSSPYVRCLLNGTEFHTGDTLIVSLYVGNGPDATPVEVKTWATFPDGSTVPLLDPHFTFTVSPNAGTVVEILRYTFTGDEPSGLYDVGGCFLNDLTGRELSVSVEPFYFAQ